MLIMSDGEGKVRTAGNMFYNTLSARQALCRHLVEVVAINAAAHTDVPASCRDYFDDVDIPTLLAEQICYLYLQLIALHRHVPSSSSMQFYDNAKRPTRYVSTNHCPTRHVK
jgi:hypothetical protein